jgi:hypothetical protein
MGMLDPGQKHLPLLSPLGALHGPGVLHGLAVAGVNPPEKGKSEDRDSGDGSEIDHLEGFVGTKGERGMEELFGYAYSRLMLIADWPNQTDLENPDENWEAMRLAELAHETIREIDQQARKRQRANEPTG